MRSTRARTGLVSAEIGARNTSGRGAAVLALALLFGYEAGRYMLGSRAVEILGSRLYQGEAPARITASRVRNGIVERTRPLCPFPQSAHYTGQGSTDDERNFVCAAR